MQTFLTRLEQATNAHDVDGLVACFAPGYRNETPAHPARGFVGVEQVRANWLQIFGGVPDLQTRVLAHAGTENEIWSEWEMHGTRRDGTAHRMRGVIIFVVEEDRAASARFYLEPVDESAAGVDETVRRQVLAEPTP